MKILSASLLATVAILLTGGSAFGQIQQGIGRNNQCRDAGDRNGRPIARFINGKGFPDKGWSPPVHYPVNYNGAWYAAYHPKAYYGNPGGGFVASYPAVYQPNDTTQLGYSYLKVPTWQSRPDLLPPVPHPSNFHDRGCPNGHCGFGHSGFHSQSCQHCNNGLVEHQHVVHSNSMSPAGNPIVRPATKQQGAFGDIRFASLTELFD